MLFIYDILLSFSLSPIHSPFISFPSLPSLSLPESLYAYPFVDRSIFNV
jgi:hypothetical protein